MSQLTFSEIEYSSKKKVTRKEIFFEKMEKIIPFQLCLNIIRPFYAVAGNGRQPIPLETMFRMYLVQSWYNTSDEATEDLLYENDAVRRFVGVRLNVDAIPDETTLWRFKDMLVKNGLTETIFEAINVCLAEGGVLCKAGTIVDATIIEAPSSTKNRDKKRDPAMSSTRKNNKYHFGFKSHIGVDDESGLIHSIETTTASVADIDVAVELFHGEEQRIRGDAGFVGIEKREDIINKFGAEPECNLPPRPIKRGRQPKQKPILRQDLKVLVNKKRKKISSLPEGEEKTTLKAIEKAKSQIRYKVELPFRYVKQVFGFRKTRVRGLEKNHAMLCMMYALTNLYICVNKGVLLINNKFYRGNSVVLQTNL